MPPSERTEPDDLRAWKEIESLLETAQKLHGAELDRFLNSLRDKDAGVFREVDSLLKAMQQVSGFLETPPALLSDWSPAELAPGQKAGPYQIERLLGRGGMGSVYLAARADEAFEKKVAIKQINRERLNHMSVRRFQLERQILASLEHPNIARLLDGGTTENGVPYLVMEYVDGLPIDTYCDQHRLSISERIDLFLKVCQAVQHAHQKLLVHRDIKPRNILVDREGVPKLLDFGIAKILEPQAVPDSSDTTRTWMRPLTPDFASPEQLRGRQITTATDVYSLGVVLYQLLTGSRPFHFPVLNLEEIERVLAEEEPPKPSTVLSRPIAGREDVAAPVEAICEARGTSPKRLRSRLAGDLDNILLMALRKDPDRRYASVEQLTEDLRRYTEGQPVLARQKALGYRLSKFAWRHRLILSFAAILAVLGLGFLAQTLQQAENLFREHTRAERERIKAEQVAGFLVDLLREADPSVALGESPSVREVLIQGSRKIPQQLPGQPEIQIEWMHAMGMIYLNLGLFDEARKLLEESLGLQRRAGSNPAQLTATLTGLGRCYADQGNYPAAKVIHREAWLRRLASRGEEHPEVAESLYFLAHAHHFYGQTREARELVHEALDMQRRLLAAGHPDIARQDIAQSLDLLGYISVEGGALDDAERFLLEALDIRDRGSETHLPALAKTLNMLATLRNAQGFQEEAATLHRRVLEIHQGMYKPEHPLIAESLNNLANAVNQTGQHQEAIRLVRRALEILKKLHGENHRYVITAMHNLGDFLRRDGQYAESERVLKRAMDALPAELPKTHPGKMFLSSALGKTLLDGQKPRQAEPLLRQALDLRKSLFPPGHVQIAGEQTSLGRCLTALGRFQEAEELLNESLAMLESTPQTAPLIGAHTRETLLRLAELHDRWGQPNKAEEYRRRLASSMPAASGLQS